METTARPLRADAARNRERILAAAAEVFADRGLDATLDDVAHHAGVGTGTVYRRFADKEELVEVLFEQRLDATVAFARECLAAADPWAGLEALLRRTASQLAGDRAFRQVMLGSGYGVVKVARGREQMIPLCEALVARAQAAGVLRPEVRAADVPMVLLMVGTAAEFAGGRGTEVWPRYLTFLLDGWRVGAPVAAALPEALSEEDMAAAMAGWGPGRRR